MFVNIDGKECSFVSGEYIVDVAGQNGIEIPTLCHHEGLRGLGCCRVCIVELNNKIVPACVTKLEKESVVFTTSERVQRERGILLSFLRKRVPESTVIAEMAKKYNAPDMPRLKAVEDSNNCIMCGLCVRACRSIGAGAISTTLRGTRKEVNTPYGEASSSCIGCASCASVCPTGNIEVVDENGRRRIWNKTFELVVCDECGSVIGTKEYCDFVIQKDKQIMEPILCDVCKKRSLALALSNELFMESTVSK